MHFLFLVTLLFCYILSYITDFFLSEWTLGLLRVNEKQRRPINVFQHRFAVSQIDALCSSSLRSTAKVLTFRELAGTTSSPPQNGQPFSPFSKKTFFVSNFNLLQQTNWSFTTKKTVVILEWKPQKKQPNFSFHQIASLCLSWRLPRQCVEKYPNLYYPHALELEATSNLITNHPGRFL